MKKNILTLSFSILFGSILLAGNVQIVEEPIILHTLSGTLTLPGKSGPVPLALIIAGSGPTDRDGNNPMMKNNSLKMLAIRLATEGIATVRYDKRGIGESAAAGPGEADLRFDHYVNDAKGWIQHLRTDTRFSTITVIGHSEGSLIGMIAASDADKFISIAGAGQAADILIRDQLSTQPKAVTDMTTPILESLKQGRTVDDVNPSLHFLFRPSVQPYMISWFKYDPRVEISKLTIPVMIVQGTNDLQVTMSEAEKLAAAKPDAKMVKVVNMNHVLKIATDDHQANIATYNNPDLPVAEELLMHVTAFIKS